MKFTSIKQAFYLLKENKVLSIISILGTALAISMIMVIIILFRARLMDNETEINRNRTLYFSQAKAEIKENESVYTHNFSPQDIKEMFYPLTTPEVVTSVYGQESVHTRVPGGRERMRTRILYTDAGFWKVFRLRFLSGSPFDESVVRSGIKNVVISESTARKLYGGVDRAVGKTIRINFMDYTVVGVVKDVNKLSESSYADIWIPYSVKDEYINFKTSGRWEGRLGRAKCYILAADPKDFNGIRQEVASALARYNSTSRHVEVSFDPPKTYTDRMFESMYEDTNDVILKYTVVVLILLLVPGINLSGIAYSEMKKRLPEIGIRKAFGASRVEIMLGIMRENLLLSLLGGAIGLLFSYLALYLLSDWLLASKFGGAASMTLSMFSPWIFGIAFLFCLLINLLSAGVPAWRASGAEVTVALNSEKL